MGPDPNGAAVGALLALWKLRKLRKLRIRLPEALKVAKVGAILLNYRGPMRMLKNGGL